MFIGKAPYGVLSWFVTPPTKSSTSKYEHPGRECCLRVHFKYLHWNRAKAGLGAYTHKHTKSFEKNTS
jgi:hypothetical protein